MTEIRLLERRFVYGSIYRSQRASTKFREFCYDDTPFGNRGVAQGGGAFLGINYGRLGRFRRVTGYTGDYDWTQGVKHPEDDRIFRVDVAFGKFSAAVFFSRLWRSGSWVRLLMLRRRLCLSITRCGVGKEIAFSFSFARRL
ncbi:MAG: hypothetical protein M2R45_01490 [Verrucomicrobia subdivision 3 bacterium]|nr:hypothetical protein [Limisphaerales bacterium]MCS1413380.1 hypothetical protein [Limisphaerales bacterium]